MKDFKALFELASDAIFVLENSKFIDCNKMALKIFGLKSKKDVIGHSPWKFFPLRQPDGSFSKNKAMQLIAAAEGGKTLRVSWRHIRKDGAAFDTEVSLARIPDPSKKLLLAIIRDITEKLKAEKQLKQSEERFRRIFESAPVAMAIGRHDKILFVNHSYLKLYGFQSSDELMGTPVVNQWAPESQEWMLKQIRKGLRDELGSWQYEGMGKRKNGSCFPVLIIANTIDLPDGKAKLCFFLDISERKRAEEEMVRKNIALSEIIKQIDFEKEKIKQEVAINVETFLIPVLKKLYLKGGPRSYIHLLEHNLKELVSSFGLKITDKKARLTPKEIELCNMIQSGLSTKEIAELLNVSPLTINKHRRNIRKKLGISNKESNLTSYLRTS